MRLLHLLASLFVSASAFSAEAPQDSLMCVPQCWQRTITQMCTNYGPDFCTPYEGTACIPYCKDRSITGMCLSYGPDYCGVYPECQPYCERRSVGGRCLSYGPDACF